jgi:shikimate kinase
MENDVSAELSAAGRGDAPADRDPGMPAPLADLRERLGSRAIVLVGLMGAGKTTIGRRLAGRLSLPFKDADLEIETAAGMSVPDIFAIYGEAAFRDTERRVIARLLGQGPLVLATGGGAYMHPQTRERIREFGLSIWLKADHETLMRRVRRRSNRPLLKTADPDETMRRLIAERHPVYAEAEWTIESNDGSHDRVVQAVIDALTRRWPGGDKAQ